MAGKAGDSRLIPVFVTAHARNSPYKSAGEAARDWYHEAREVEGYGPDEDDVDVVATA
jgi:hypothetical protein